MVIIDDIANWYVLTNLHISDDLDGYVCIIKSDNCLLAINNWAHILFI